VEYGSSVCESGIKMKVTLKSQISGNKNSMELDVTHEQLEAWDGGMLIQRAMPNLTATEREFLITGMSAEEQKRLYG